MQRWMSACSLSVVAAGFLAACSSTVTPQDSGHPCTPACGLNETCDTTTGQCNCYPSYTKCAVNEDAGSTSPSDAGAGNDGGLVDGGLVDAGPTVASACVNLLSSSFNCGACGTTCPVGDSCLDGQCTCDPNTRNICTDDAGTSVCSDPSSDSQNCGRCGNPCAPGQTCANSACSCATDDAGITLQPCNAGDGGLFCADLTTDNNNCGSCGNACAPDEHCASSGSNTGNCICNKPLTACNGACVDTRKDPLNCGSCGNFCITGACNVGPDDAGVCECHSPYLVCFDTTSNASACIDPNSNVNFCGGCGNGTAGIDCTTVDGESIAASEPGGVACNSGQCVCGQAGQGTICPDGCQDTLTDPTNCGGCGAGPNGLQYNCTNGPNSACQRGQCVCPNGGLFCGADAGVPGCYAGDKDNDNCGSCGNVCSNFAMGATCNFGNCGCNPAILGTQNLCAIPPGNGGRPSCSCDEVPDAGSEDPLYCHEQVKFARDVFPLLAQTSGAFGCAASGCHAGSTPAAGLAFDVDAGVAYNVLLGLSARAVDAGPVPYCDGGTQPDGGTGAPVIPGGQPSAFCGCDSLVVPGPGNVSIATQDKTTQSYFYRVLANRGLCNNGLAMPIDKDGGWVPLDPCSVQLVEQWIQQGANF